MFDFIGCTWEESLINFILVDPGPLVFVCLVLAMYAGWRDYGSDE